MIHEDDRRRLEDFPEGKLIQVKEDTVLGKHYHKIKTETFVLLEGQCFMLHTPVLDWVPTPPVKMVKGELYNVPPNTYHEFHLTKGSILIGLCTNPYDPTDEYTT